MPTTSQIVPEHDYAHVMTVIHDNSQRPSDAIPTVDSTFCNMMFVFSSPKGIDRELQTVTGLSEFTERFGVGTFDACGQAFLNAYAAASTNAATLHCLRVTADDATYAAGALVAHYKVTPGTTTPDTPVVPVSSTLVNLNGHEDLVATDETDDFGVTTISVSGVDIAAGISDDNIAVFGDITGEYIDITVDVAKLVDLADDKTYRVVQTNPCLELYPNDEFVSQVDGIWTKSKTYSGADLKEGYSLLLSSSTVASISIVEWGESEDEPEVYIRNSSDFGFVCADSEAHIEIADFIDDAEYGADAEVKGSVVAGVIDPTLWGSISGNNLEIQVKFPNLNVDTTYKVTQTNANLELYSGDSTVEHLVSGWTKSKTYTGAELADGYAVLLGEGKGDITIITNVIDEDGTENMDPTHEVHISNKATFVAAHPTKPGTGAIGDETVINVESAIAFVGNSSTSVRLRAQTAYNRAVRAATADTETESTAGEMDVYFTFEAPNSDVTDTTNFGNLVDVPTGPDSDGYSAVKIFELMARGRGEWGDNIRFVIENYARGDRLSSYKNYKMTVYEINNATLVRKEEHVFSFNPAAVSADGTALFAELVIGNPFKASNYLDIKVNIMATAELYTAYKRAMPEASVTEETFDLLTGHVFANSNKTLDGYVIDTTSNGTISLSGASGISLLNGNDGAFDIANPDRAAALEAAYLKAYSGEIDRNVFSKKLYPTDIVLDANFAPETKIAIHELVDKRQDCFGFFDLGTEMNTYAGLLESLADIEPYVNTRNEAIEGYRGKIQDPVSHKVIDVTSTYVLALMYPLHFQANGGKHVPLAGSAYGVINGFISGTAWPVYDDDLDSEILDELTDNKVNFLKVNTRKQVVRGAQTTRQDVDTNLSEVSNVFILLDIRRDAVQLCEMYEYNFSEEKDLQRFNKAATILTDKYADKQVKSISAEFTMNDWEAERGILHLYIDFVHKGIIKRSIVEISVNRGTVEN